MNAPTTARLTGVKEFVESEYLAHIRASLSPSTVDGYLKLWNTYGTYFNTYSLDLRTCDAQAILRKICADRPHLNRTSISHAKNFFSGIWGHALRMGSTEQENPWRSVKIPQAPDARDTYAYSPAEIESILKATPAPYDLVILLAACTGLRKSEIRGLRWQDWDPASSTLSVSRARWRTFDKTTKSKASKAPVPVVPVLAERLKTAAKGKKETAPIFPSSTGTPLDLDNLARRVIIPAVGNLWKGYHAFRRGLATFLHSKSVDDKTIQAILRHENVSITQQCYVKTVPESVRKAMETVTFGGSN